MMNRANRIRTELERRILNGLVAHYHDVLGYLLDDRYRQMMRTPLFRLEDLTRRLGYWSPEKREICLSREFVHNAPWDAVCDVLRHEMAHQLAFEALGGRYQKPHGPAFQEACRMLRASPEASGTYFSLHERLAAHALGQSDKMLVKIKKLMALSESCNAHEAEAALAKAYEMMAKYNLELMARQEERVFFSVFVGQPALRRFRDTYYLANLLIDFYFVRGIWVSAFVLEKNQMGRVLEISGTARNIQVAAYVYDYIERYIDAHWRMYNGERRLGRAARTDFGIGIINGFRSKLESRSKPNETAPLNRLPQKIEDPQLRNYIRRRYPYLRTSHKKRLDHDEQVLQDGFETGLKLNIAEGIGHSGKPGVALITE